MNANARSPTAIIRSTPSILSLPETNAASKRAGVSIEELRAFIDDDRRTLSIAQMQRLTWPAPRRSRGARRSR
jgi:hypothetical protein